MESRTAGGTDRSHQPPARQPTSNQAASLQLGTPHSVRSTTSEQGPGKQTIMLVKLIAGPSLINWRDADAMHMCNAEQFRARHDLDAVN